MAAFDFGKLLQDPTFQFGTNLLFNARQPNAIGQSYGLMQKTLAAKQQEEEARQTLLDHQQQRQLQQVINERTGRFQEAQMKNFDVEAANKDRAINLQGAAEARKGQLADLQAERDRRKDAEDEVFMKQIENSGLFGPSPQGGAAPTPGIPGPTMKPSPSGPSIFKKQGWNGQDGRWGTPAYILDNNGNVESGNNPNAVNPESGAIGLHQFLPTTAQMLAHKTGTNFNPRNPYQSRDMADYYIQDLVHQNGGSYEKALAQYGGFKTKDPTQYVARNMGTEPAAATGAPALPQARPGMDVAKLGAMMAMHGRKGGAQMVELGKMMEPKSVSPNSYQMDSQGNMTFVGDKYKEADQNLAERKFGLDEAKASRDVAKDDQQIAETAQKHVKEQSADTLAYRNITSGYDRLYKNADELLNHPGLSLNTGLYGAAHVYNATQNGRDANASLETLKSKLVVDTLKSLKQSSSNGSSGFGSLSDREGQRLETLVANLSQSQSLPSMKKALSEIKAFASESHSNFDEQFKGTYGELPSRQQATTPLSAAPAAGGEGGAMSLDDYIKKHQK